MDEHQTQGDHRLQSDAEKLVGNDAEDLKDRVQVPLGEDLKWGGEGIGAVAQHGRIENRQANKAGNGPENHNREDVKEIVRPGRLAVVVVTHALGQLGPQLGIGEIWLLKDVHGSRC